MKTLPAGPLKFLLLDHYDIARNTERDNAGEPVVVIAVEDGDGNLVLHRGYNAHVEGVTNLAYRPRIPLFTTRLESSRNDMPHHAAWCTTAQVLLAEHPEEILAAAPAATKKTTKKEA